MKTDRNEAAPDRPAQSGKATREPRSKKSQFEEFASTQAAGDGIQGDTLKKDKSAGERIGANMADRK